MEDLREDPEIYCKIGRTGSDFPSSLRGVAYYVSQSQENISQQSLLSAQQCQSLD